MQEQTHRHMITLYDCLIPSPHTASDTLEDQVIIIDVITGSYFSLNSTGAFLWERLDGRTSLGVIAEALADAFGVDPKQTRSDVLELAVHLMEEGLVEKV
ncbi:MAG: PqqD family protein [Chloroflexi bacterium]|nr:PqqD family protein [Chloroflexota bacterium]